MNDDPAVNGELDLDVLASLGAPFKAHVLLVDDELNLLQIVTMMLEALGYSVTAYDNGKAALQFLQQQHVDAVLTDWQMPDMQGSELIERLQQIQGDVPIVVCTGYGDDIEAAGLSVASILRKPMDIIALGKTLRQVLA